MNPLDRGDQQRLMRWGGVGLVNLATLTWASNMTLGRWLRDDIGPLTLAASRFLIASSLLAALLRRLPPEKRRMGEDRWLLMGMALSGVVAFAPTLYLGLRHTTTVNATLINGTGPLITGLFAALLIGERMTGRQIGGAVLGLIGVIALVSDGHVRFWRSMESSIGDLIVLGAVALWGLYSVLGRRAMVRHSALSASVFSALLGLPVLLLAAGWETHASGFAFDAKLVLPLLYIGIAPGVVGLLSWNAGVRRLGASGAMVFYNTLPVYGALLGHFLLGEPLGRTHLAGGTLIVCGGLWAARRNRGSDAPSPGQPPSADGAAERRSFDNKKWRSMTEINIKTSEHSDGYRFEVVVQEGESRTHHAVTLNKTDYKRLSRGQISPKELVSESFRLLLEREPKESILRSFDLAVISRYFPEYERELAKRR